LGFAHHCCIEVKTAAMANDLIILLTPAVQMEKSRGPKTDPYRTPYHTHWIADNPPS